MKSDKRIHVKKGVILEAAVAMAARQTCFPFGRPRGDNRIVRRSVSSQPRIASSNKDMIDDTV